MSRIFACAIGLLGCCLLDAPANSHATAVRVFTINDHLLAFCDGRPPEPRGQGPSRDWADSGAYDVGVCTYAIHRGRQALVYDSYPDVREAQWVRQYLARRGIRHFTLVNSHWHLDHVGGNAVYEDADRIATQRTIDILREKQASIEAGSEWGPPAIKPLVLPTIGIAHETHVNVMDIDVVLRPVNIHSADGLVLYIPRDQLLLAGDTLEDTVTFVSEPAHIGEHIRNLRALKRWNIRKILPNHGNPAVIAAGGYSLTLVDATFNYLSQLAKRAGEPNFMNGSLDEYVKESVERGWVSIWWAYRDAHAQNLKRIAEAYKTNPSLGKEAEEFELSD